MVNKVLFSLSVILIFITSTIVIAEEQTTIKTEYPQIAMFNRDGLLYSDSGRRVTNYYCAGRKVNDRPECEPPNNQRITNSRLKEECKEVIKDQNVDFGVDKDTLDLENPICNLDCLCSAEPKPKTAARP